MTIDYLFIITFVFGTLMFLTQTKLFDATNKTLLEVLFAISLMKETRFKLLINYIDRIILYLCISYQVYWWMNYIQ